MKTRVSIFDAGVLISGVFLAIISAAICMQIMGLFGTTPNTSLIGAVLIMIVARIPLHVLTRLRHKERQNYILTIASSAGFSAANCGFIAIATVFMFGRNDLIFPVAIGALIGSMLSVFIIGRIFDSKIFPAKAAWPMGKAIANVVDAGDAGGKKTFELFQGIGVGALASFFGIPAAGVGVAFIANMLAMGALGVGMILRGHSTLFFRGFDIGESGIAQGIMIGAGLVALIQIIVTLMKKSKTEEDSSYTVSDKATRSVLGVSTLFFVAGAVVLGVISGAFSDMSSLQTAMWVLFSGISSIVVVILVGRAAMQTGWAPAFAVVTICLTIGLFAGFPPMPLAVLVGYIGSVGLPMHDTGQSLKAGWLIRGQGEDAEYELYGRRQQVIGKQFGVVIGIAMALVFSMILISENVIPPMSIFYANTVAETVDIAFIRELLIWAVPGAVLQAAFGSRSVGLMLATGLLINNPVFGIAVLSAIVLRLIFGTKHMEIRAPGLIAGDGLFGFGANIFRALF